jgi:hypothetical protein
MPQQPISINLEEFRAQLVAQLRRRFLQFASAQNQLEAAAALCGAAKFEAWRRHREVCQVELCSFDVQVLADGAAAAWDLYLSEAILRWLAGNSWPDTAERHTHQALKLQDQPSWLNNEERAFVREQMNAARVAAKYGAGVVNALPSLFQPTWKPLWEVVVRPPAEAPPAPPAPAPVERDKQIHQAHADNAQTLALSAKTLADELHTNPKLVEALNVLVHELSLRRSRDAKDPWPVDYWIHPSKVVLLLVADDPRKELIMPPFAVDKTFEASTLETAISNAQTWVDEQRANLHTGHFRVKGWQVVPGNRLAV